MQPYLKIVGNGHKTSRSLTSEEAEAVMEMILSGKASVPQIAAFIAIQRFKEESAEELAAFARVLRRYCERITIDLPNLIEICIPYDGRVKSPLLIPAAAMIAASCGVQVALHGRKGQNTPPKFGIGVGDVLEALGIDTSLSLQGATAMLQETGVAYVDSTQFAPRLEQFNQLRLDYGMRSFLNTIEKLINPFNAPIAIMGVFHGNVVARVAQAMQAQGYRRGMAIQGSEGSIDILTSRRSNIVEFNNSTELREWTIDPAEFGWWEKLNEFEAPLTPGWNAELTIKLLDPANNEDGYRRSTMMTAALMIYASGKVESFEKGRELAQVAVASKAALQHLETLRQKHSV